LQNGLGQEETVARMVHPRRILSGLCFVCSNKEGPGTIRHLDYGRVVFGEYDPGGAPKGVTDLVRAVASDFRRAGLPVDVTDDVILARWKKLSGTSRSTGFP